MTKKRLLARALARAGNDGPKGSPEPPDPLALGFSFFRQGNYRETLQAWEKAPAPPAAMAEALFRLGLEHQAAGKTRAALGWWHQAAGRQPERAVYHFHCGLAAHRLGDLTAAAASYRQALQGNPNGNTNRILFHLGLALVMLSPDSMELPAWLAGEGQNLPPAERRFLLAACCTPGQDPPPEPGERDLAGTHLLQALQAEPLAALTCIEEALALETQNPAAWRMRSLVLAALGDPAADAALQQALALGARREELVPRVIEQKKAFLNHLVEEGDLARAADFLTGESKTLAPVDPRGEKTALLLTALGDALGRRQEWAQAAGCWRKARELGRRDPRLLHNLALAAELLGQTGEAAFSWRRTIDAWTGELKGQDEGRLAQYLAIAFRHLAELEADQGRYEEYVIDLQLAIKYAPADVQIRLDLARAYASFDEEDKCLAVLEEALPLAPENTEIISGLAFAYLKRDELQKAGHLLTSGLAVAPEDPHLRKCMASYYLKRSRDEDRDYDSAIGWMVKALEITPERVPVLVRLAVFAYINNHRRDYRKYLDEALSLQPGDPDVYFDAAGLFFDCDCPDMGKKNVKLALAGAPDDPGAYLEAAGLYLEGELPVDAGKCLQRALKLNPALKIYERAAELCIEHDQWELALPILTEARKAFPDQPEIVVDLVGVLVELDRFPQAYRTILTAEEQFQEVGLDPVLLREFRTILSFLEEELD
ncbi:MAG TPA: tetratricopeptide repeat protein [Spirochaetia bacterium]|nr:tetratricopeptide repeat protein [Spirochaetia bacterium]